MIHKLRGDAGQVTGCVEADLMRAKEMLLKIAEHPDCVKLLGYDGWQVQWFIQGGIDRALKHYRSEAKRVKERHRRKYT